MFQMATKKVSSFYAKLILLAILTLVSTQNISSIIERTTSACNFNEVRSPNIGVITQKEKGQCIYTVRTLAEVNKHILVLDTGHMNCTGNDTKVFFWLDTDKNFRGNFCRRPQCLVYTRHSMNPRNIDVRRTIGDPFTGCQYKIIKRPGYMTFNASQGTNSFTLRYKLFNLVITKTNGTTPTKNPMVATIADILKVIISPVNTSTSHKEKNVTALTAEKFEATTNPVKTSTLYQESDITALPTEKFESTSSHLHTTTSHEENNGTITTGRPSLTLYTESTTAKQEVKNITTHLARKAEVTITTVSPTRKQLQNITIVATVAENVQSTSAPVSVTGRLQREDTTSVAGEHQVTSIPNSTKTEKLLEVTTDQAGQTQIRHNSMTTFGRQQQDTITSVTENIKGRQAHVLDVRKIQDETTTVQGMDRASRMESPPETWHYVLPITLGILLIIGIALIIFYKRKKRKMGKGTVEASFTATYFSN